MSLDDETSRGDDDRLEPKSEMIDYRPGLTIESLTFMLHSD